MNKFKAFLALSVLAILLASCSDDDTVKDQIYEFLSFQDEEISITENTSEDTEVVLKLLGYKPTQDITVNLAVTNNNVQEGVDYTLSTKTVTIKKGEFVSEPFYITTIDNNVGVDTERSFTLSMESSSNPDINFGVGFENPEKEVLKVVIVDDECTDTVDIFNATLSNSNSSGSQTITGSLSGDILSLTGDLIIYSPFSNASLEVTLTPDSVKPTIGTATFTTFDSGTDNDGYVYQFRQAEAGTYDACSGTVTLHFDVYYLDGGNWVFWFTSNNTIQL